jgi:predicted TIM-barrel fold metal-dependent hydrolase
MAGQPVTAAASGIDVHQHIGLGDDEFDLFDVPAEAAFDAWLNREAATLPALPPGWARVLLPPIYFKSTGGAKDVRRLNDLMAAAAARPEFRAMAAFGVVEPQQGEASFEELDRMARIGLAGPAFSPRAQGVFADTPELVALVRRATAQGLLSALHATPASGNEALWRIWNLAAQCAPVPILALGALAGWENVQAILAGGGPGNLYYDTARLAGGVALGGLATKLGSNRLLYGGGGSAEAIPEALRDGILRDNALRLLGARAAA